MGDIYNLNGVHVGNDGVEDNQVYLAHTIDDSQLSQQESAQMTAATNSLLGGYQRPLTNITATTGLTNDELNLRAALTTLKQAEAGSANPPLEYNAWNRGDDFTSETYESSPSDYDNHPGMNNPGTARAGSAAGAYQALERFYTGSDFSPASQDRAAVSNMTSMSYNAAVAGDVARFKSTTSARWTSLDYWSVSDLQTTFNTARAAELTGNSKIAAPVGTLLRR